MMSERPSLHAGRSASGIALRMQQCREFDAAKVAGIDGNAGFRTLRDIAATKCLTRLGRG
jgi:hypothetical protein